jgi:hypothetical protein
MSESTLVDQARRFANDAENEGLSLVADLLRQLADRVQELEGKGEPVARVEPFGATVKLEWTSVEAAHNAKPGPLYASPPSSVQPEKEERRPLTAQQVLAAAACHERGRVVISTVQRALRIGYREADELCRSIIAAGLVDGLEISPALLPVSPSPSMVGREGDGK